MPRYPFTPELLDAIPEELAGLYRSLESQLLEEICSRLNLADKLNEVTVQSIRSLRSHGISQHEIERAIRRTTNISEKKLRELLDDVVERNQKYYEEVIDLAKVTAPETLVGVADVDAIRRQTVDSFKNITASMAFIVDNGRTLLPPAQAYQWALDNAVLQVQSGAISYNQAIRYAVKQLADSGIRVTTYESGHRDQIDVAVRRAIMTGVNQLCQKYAEQSEDYLRTDLVEVSAHIGARDTGSGPENHKGWQGKVYRWSEKPKASYQVYPDFLEITGYGTGPGLGGWNCRHHFYPFVEGVSERTYTDEQLAHIDDGHDVEFEGKHYSAYEATQKQRQIERTVRKLKREQAAFRAAGLTEEEQAVSIRLRRLTAEYKAFIEAAGLPVQRERMRVYEEVKKVENPAVRDTMEKMSGGGSSVHTVGRIDVEKYKVVTDTIRTDEVVITDERIEHIKDHHPNDYERFVSYIPQIISDPDYIVEANKAHTAVILKEVLSGSSEKFKLILRLSIPGDPEEYKNSVISFWKIGETTWRKTIKNKKILYKKG